jgi:DNA-binding transcriptional LysR family regulator
MNILDFDLNLLTVFDAVLAERSISRAAGRLDLSQPAVSNALARMRKATGDRLFVRLGNAMVPTPYAQGIADPIRQALTGIRIALGASQEFDPATSPRSFAIFLTDLGEAFFLPRLLARLNRIAPGVHIRTLPMPPEAAEDALRNGEVDLAIGNLPDFRRQLSSGKTIRIGRVPIFAPVTSSTATALISVPVSASRKRTSFPPPRCWRPHAPMMKSTGRKSCPAGVKRYSSRGGCSE